MKQKIQQIVVFARKHPLLVTLIGGLLLTLIGAYIFYERFPYAVSAANLYAEDGSIFVKNVYDKGFLPAAATLFNGYLVIGQYIILGGALLINAVLGHGFGSIAKSLAAASYLFLGFTCALPWVLFRRKIGALLSALALLLLTLLPLGGYDYAVIGTLGNLKFAFLFIAALLVIYRNDTGLCKKTAQLIAVDVALLLCVLTNAVCVAVLPFLLWRYRQDIKVLFTKWRLPKLTLGHYSAIVMLLVSFVYIVAVYLHGIPKMPGYLDGPFEKPPLIAILFRGSIYGLLFPVYGLLNDHLAVAIMALCTGLAIWSRDRMAYIIMIVGILASVLGFALNRPGVTGLFHTYLSDGGAGLFFYGGTLLFTFGVAYASRGWFNKLPLIRRGVVAIAVVLAFFVMLPAAGLRTTSYHMYMGRPTLKQEVARACATGQNMVQLKLYPTEGWNLRLQRDKVCQ